MPLATAEELITLCQYLFPGTEFECRAAKPCICNANDILNVSPENERTARGRPGRGTVLKPGSSINNTNFTVITPNPGAALLWGHI